jgi:hypothetical protein
VRHDQARGRVPSGTVDHQDRVGAFGPAAAKTDTNLVPDYVASSADCGGVQIRNIGAFTKG